MDRPPHRLADDVPKSYVNGPGNDRGHTRDGVPGAENQGFPMAFHVPGVLALQGRLDGIVDVSLHNAGIPSARFGEPDDPFARIYAYQQSAGLGAGGT